MGRLQSKVALVTGAAGGLGRCLTETFAAEGARVFACDVDESRLRHCLEQIGKPSSMICGAAANLSSSGQAESIIARAVSAFGHIDILVNNAAVADAKTIWDVAEADWDSVLAINVKGLFFMLRAAAKQMVSAQRGSIINVASVAGRVGRPLLIPYAASKAAVISITRSCALALAPHGIRVNAVAPGMINTNMLRGLRESWSRISETVGPTPQPYPDGTIPLGRVAEPADIVGAVIYLSTEESAYITGQTLNVCGGIVMS